MSGSKSSFVATVKVQDDASAPLKLIREQMAETGRAARRTGHEVESIGLRHHFHGLREGLATVRERVARIGEAARGSLERIAELIPALGALGAVGSVAGLAELVSSVAEAREQFAATAEKIGVTTGQLGQLNFAAKMSGISVDSMQTGLLRLERGMANAASGKAKDIAAVFAHMHYSLRGADGQIRSVTDVIPRLADAFERTKDASQRTQIAMLLFGKSGAELLPMLRHGGTELKEFFAQLKGLLPQLDEKAIKGLEDYQHSMIKLQTAVAGVRMAIGAQLAPVLQPIIEQFKDWLVTNRDWIALNLKRTIFDIAEYLKSVDWRGLGDDIRGWMEDIRWAVNELGGLRRALEVILAIKIGSWALGVAGALAKIAGAAGDAASKLRGAKAAAAEGGGAVAGAEAGAAGAAAGAAARRGALRTVGSVALRAIGPAAVVAYEMAPATANAGEDDALRRLNLRPQGMPDAASLSRQVYDPSRGRWSDVRLHYQAPAADLPRVVPTPLDPRLVAAPLLSDQNPLEQLRRARAAPLEPVGGAVPALPANVSDPIGAVVRRLRELFATPAPAAMPTLGASFEGLPILPPQDRAASPAPPPPPGKVDLAVRFANAPPGMTTSVDSRGRAIGNVTVDLGEGFSGMPGYDR